MFRVIPRLGQALAALAFLSQAVWATEPTPEEVANHEAAVAKILAIRQQAVRQMDGDFFKAEKFTPAQEELFIATRIAAEDRVREQVHRNGPPFLPGMLTKEMDASLATAFSPELAQRYRDFANAKLGREMMLVNAELHASEWLTPEEQDKLALQWGSIVAASMDVTFDPKFEKATPEEKKALGQKILADYYHAAESVLDQKKLAKLRERLDAMWQKGLEEFEKAK